MFSRRHGVGRRGVAVLLLALAALLAAAGPAAAHPTLLMTVPAAGYTGDGPLPQVVLAFDEPVTVTADAVSLTSASGQHVPTRRLQRRAGGRQLILPLLTPLTSGQFRVRWQVTAADGDVVDGAFTFGVGAAAPKALRDGGNGGLAGTAALRWLLFTAFALAAGGVAGEWLVRRCAQRAALPTVRAPLAVASGVGLLAAAGLTVLVASATGGWAALSHVRAVELTAVEAVAFAVTAVFATVTPLRRLAAAPLTVVALAEGFRAHPHAYSPGWGAILTAVHLAAAAVWVGALVHVVRTARRTPERGRAWVLVRAYARAALPLFLLVVTTGTIASVLVLRTPGDLLHTGYGRVLTGKLLLVAVVAVLAIIGRRRVRSGTLPGAKPGRATLAERTVLLAVLAVTAVLVSLPAPRPVATALTLPPLPAGPTTGFGGLLGQLSLGATASAGQLQLQLSTPGSDPGEPGTDPDVHITVRLRPPGRTAVTIPARSCGAGCFTAATGWRTGPNELTVDARAAGWRGGSATFTVPWPPVDATAQLGAVLAALRHTGPIALVEDVSSDTTKPAGVERLRVTGPFFLASEPYGNGGASIVTALPPRRGALRLAVAYPAIGVYIDLTLDRRNRPTREIEATPDHLITRTFTYPGP